MVKHTRRIKCMWSRHKFMWLHIWEILGIDDHLLQSLHLVGGLRGFCLVVPLTLSHVHIKKTALSITAVNCPR